MTGPAPSMHVIGRGARADPTGAGEASTGAGEAPTGAGEASTGAGEASTGAGEAPTGARPPTGHFGRYLARDGSTGAAVGIDLDRPHAALVVGKRGAGKSHTLGVLAEAAARAEGVAPVVCDPMGAFDGLAGVAVGAPVPATVVDDPRVRADAIPPGAWPGLVGLDATDAAGALVWDAAAATGTLDGMLGYVAGDDSDGSEDGHDDREFAPEVSRVAANHLRRAAAWDVFDPDGLDASALCGGAATVLSLAGVDDMATGAVVAAVARTLYDARVAGETDRLPWLFVDEAQVAFDGVAGRALRTLLTRGRAPGVSVVLATQRPSALPDVAVSQADLLVAHRLTGEADLRALERARPTYLDGGLAERMPSGTGEALVVDDATESVHVVRVRERETPHGGETPKVSDRDRGTTPRVSVRGGEDSVRANGRGRAGDDIGAGRSPAMENDR